jgi:hypothetical protein
VDDIVQQVDREQAEQIAIALGHGDVVGAGRRMDHVRHEAERAHRQEDDAEDQSEGLGVHVYSPAHLCSYATARRV